MSTPAPVSAHERARGLLDQIKVDSNGTPEGCALWWAVDGLTALLRNNSGLGEGIEAIAARVSEALHTHP